MTNPKPQITCTDHCDFGDKLCLHIIEPKHEGDKILCKHPDHFLCTETLKYEPSRVSYSAIADHMRCPKLDWYKNVCGLEPVEQLASDAVKMGNVWEAWLELQSHTIDTYAPLKLKYLKIINANPLPDRENAIINALTRAMADMKLSIPPGEWQVKDVVGVTDSDGISHPVSMVFDVLHEDSFSEIKLCGQFRYYDNAWAVRDQVGLYLALNPELKYVTMYVVQKPQHKVLQGSKNVAPETITEFENRVYNIVIGDPRSFFLDHRFVDGVRTWGRRFDRAQFDMDELRLRAIEVSKLRQRAMLGDYWMMNTQNCFMYGQDCEFLSVCKNQGRVPDRFRVKETIETNTTSQEATHNESS